MEMRNAMAAKWQMVSDCSANTNTTANTNAWHEIDCVWIDKNATAEADLYIISQYGNRPWRGVAANSMQPRRF